jgi:type IV pilus assembly protein PilX
MKYSIERQSGLVMVFALLVLLSLTVLGVSSVSSSLMQNKMATSMEQSSLAFDAAEAAIAGVVFESEDEVLLSSALTDPLSEARQGNEFDPDVQDMSCYDNLTWTNRTITSAGLTTGANHNAAGSYDSSPPINSWSRTAFVREESCRGSSNVIGGSNISCHVFVVRGCGQINGYNYAVANSLKAAVFAPASQ